MEDQQLNLVPNKNAVGVDTFSAADVTADLDIVLKQLRNGTVNGQHEDTPGQLKLAPRK